MRFEAAGNVSPSLRAAWLTDRSHSPMTKRCYPPVVYKGELTIVNRSEIPRQEGIQILIFQNTTFTLTTPEFVEKLRQ